MPTSQRSTGKNRDEILKRNFNYVSKLKNLKNRKQLSPIQKKFDKLHRSACTQKNKHQN